ncbi:MAG: FTR1 family protein, partial [Betaproteobacteria bacterium]|nr:FTR1 family protein [Betaproteobacteria bacterium]
GGGGAGMLLGGVLGLLAGAAIGVAIYYGLLAVPLRQLFGVTSWLILLLAAGMASQAAAFLAAADLLPSLGNSIWDTSRILPDRNLIGQLLHVLVGYTARPAGIQLVFYAGALILIGSGMRIFGRTASDREAGRNAQPAE